MFHLLLRSSSVLFIILNSSQIFSLHSKRSALNYEPKCALQTTAVDQVINLKTKHEQKRKKRFVLFPEFHLYLNDQRYIQNPDEIRYWIANFYPKKLNSDYLHTYIKDIIKQINTVLNKEITIEEATDPGTANFHYNLFDYTKCPMNDLPEATLDNIQILDPLLIYPADLTRQNRYRAHGGIHFSPTNQPLSTIKLNMQQTFLYSDDFVYDPIIYTCNDATNECQIDLYWVLLHETLHGFGIEHTTNHDQPNPPNPHMQSVMHFSNFRTLCHDDIRAIRMIYKYPVTRKNAEFDDTCRRDFPMNKLQKLMYFIGRMIIFSFIGFAILSTITLISTLIYILINQRKPIGLKREISRNPSIVEIKKPAIIQTKKNVKPHGYLWHDDML